MASMRVHELAKEFGMDSKELLSRIQDLKIPAKSHASVLSEDNVEAIKKAIAPELGEKAENIDAEVAKIAKAEKEAAAKKKADEERERREAVERERALRDAERARRAGSSASSQKAGKPTEKKKPAPAPVSSGLSSLARQIEEQKAAEEARRAKQAADARAAKLASVPLEAPEHAIGRDPEECIKVGAVVGTAAMAEGLVARMKRELGREDATVIATGGLAGIVADSTDAFDVVDGQLTIKGICEIYRRMQELG